jgi:S-adenosylmethionine:tRNA ribosyltransferase-isomerase
MKKLVSFVLRCQILMININNFKYNLPSDKIALYPLPERDQSKLLVYQKGNIQHSQFLNLTDFLPADTFLFFNDTKVIPARLHFKKATGASIEIFLLAPLEPSTLLSEVMQVTSQCTWKCTLGNVKRWHEGTTLQKVIGEIHLEARLVSKEDGIVQFSWTNNKSFAEVITQSGETPLPPYLKREAEDADRERYQTVYSHYEGAVAAPTAGLHFTDAVFQALYNKNILYDFLTLHVSAGTFQPVKMENAEDHLMHAEQIVVTRKNIENLLTPGRFFIPVGTTSLRTLESIYWFGARLLRDEFASFRIFQDDPYGHTTTQPSVEQALEAVKAFMERSGQERIIGETSIFIKPGYPFKICNGLITNFHQPGSTLMLLVAAFVGDSWQRIYDEALLHNYRFLSFGDSSLLIP